MIHFLGGLSENRCLGIEVELAFEAECLLINADGEGDGERIAVFERNCALNAHDVGGKGDVIILVLHESFDLF